MKTVCKENACTGCMACVGICKKEAIEILDGLSAYNAIIEEMKCINCGACVQVCPNNHLVELNKSVSWNEGWAIDDIRVNSSSGGCASAIMKFFVEDGGYVAACRFKKGEFLFDITNKKEELINFAGSKYVKSNPIGIYEKIVGKLKNGNKVLFIGLPCQVAAVKNYTKMKNAQNDDNLYTVDLICHGTPSPQILNMALREKGIEIEQLNGIRFRNKTNYGLLLQDNKKQFNTITPNGVQDMYTYAFLKSLDYTENCYSCRYATKDRVSDVTLGDSWGSTLSDDEQKKGISLILCQSEKGIELVKNAGIELKMVDIDRAIKANHQLNNPPIAPDTRCIFFEELDKGFHRAISKCEPKAYYKQKIKELFVKLKFKRNRIKR